MRLQQQIRLFLVLSVIVFWTQSVYSDVYYVASSPAFTAPKAHIWNSAGGDPMYSWNADGEAMTSSGTATDGSTIYSYTYNSEYNRIIIHDNGLYSSGTLDYLNNYFYRRYPVGDGTYWWKLCASSNVEMNISTDGSRNRVDFSAGSGYTLIANVSLNASTTYQFKLHQKTEGDNNGWWGNSGYMTSTNCTNWNMTDGINDCHITTTVAGSYTFLYDYSTDQVSVLYPGANIAQGKTDKSGWSRRGSCPNQNGTETPDKSFDGNTGTKWVSYACNDLSKTWIAVDLGRAYRLSGLSTVWGWTADNTPSHYKVQVMTSTPSDFADDVAMSDNNWTTVLEVRETQQFGTDKENVYSLGAVKGRYVRLVSLDKTEMGLNELKIYAEQFAETPDVTPTMGSASLYSDYSSGSMTLTLTATDHSGNALNTFLLQDNYGIYYRVTTDGSDHATLSGLSAKRYIFTVWAIEEGNLSVGSQTVVAGEGTFSSSTNLALNKPTYAYGYTGTNYILSANDGTLNNFWSLAQPIPAADQDHVWWYVDLQDEYVLKSLSLYWEGAFANSFIWQIRKYEPTSLQADDDSAWETFLDYQGDQTAGTSESNCNLYGDTTGYKAKFSITPKGRYVRFRAKGAANWDWGVKLREVRIYGSAYLPLDDEAPVITAASYNGVTADYTGIKFNVTATDNSGLPVTEYIVVDPEGTSYKTRTSAGVVTVTGMPTFKDENVTFYAIDSAANKSVAYVVEDVSYVNPLQNLAELKTTWVSYTNDQNDEKQANLNDGVLDNNGWIPYKNTGANAWMVVDLGDTYQISSVQTFFATGRKSTSYKIYGRQEDPSSDDVRGDNTKWVELASKSSSINSGATESDVNESSVSFTGAIRYVRFESFAEEWSDPDNGFKLLEFRVFGSAYKSRDLTGPVISTCEIDESAENEASTVLHLVATDAVDGDVYNFEISTDGGSSWTKYETNHSTNLVTIDGLENGYYTFTVRAYDMVGNYSSTSSVNVVIYDPSTNLALNKTVVAGYEPGNEGEHSDKLTDGTNDAWTTFSGRPASEEWFYVDLGAYYQLSSIELDWGDVYSTDYVFQVRQSAPASSAVEEDDNLWYPVAEVTDATASSTKTTSVDVPARYIRFHSKTRSGGFLRLYEIRVYSTGFADADTHVPVITTATATYNDDGKAYLNLIATDDEDVSTNWFYLYNPSTDSYSLVQANGSNQIVIDDLTACEEYTFQVQAMDQSAQLSAVSNIAVRVPIISDTNLALNQTAVAGTTEGGFGAANAVDGNTSTMWSGNSSRNDGVNQWLYVNLGDKYDIDSVKITWNANGEGADNGTWPQDYELQVSNDGTDFQPIVHYTTTDAQRTNRHDFSNVSAQYVRVWANKAGVSYGIQISELEVYGNCYTDTDLPIMLFAETIEGEVYATSAHIYVGAIHKSIASTDLLYHVDYTDNTDGSYSGSTTISAASVTNGVFTLSGLQKGHSYTANIYVAKTSDIAENRSSNYKTVSFTTEGTYSKYYFASDTNGWLAVNGGEWTDAMDAWRFQTTEINGFYKLEHAVAADATWTYILYDRIHAGRTTPGDHKINVTAGKDFIMTMKGLEVYVSNYHTIYIAGDAVGTAENALTYALTWTDNTHAVWEGFVEPGETFRLIFPDPYAGNESYVRIDAITPSAVTYSGSQNYARLTFNLNTWEYAWTPIDFVIYRTGDKADDSRATIGSVESYAGGTINAPIEFRMKVRDLDMWHSLCLPFTVSAVKVWDEDDGAYYDIVPYYRSGGTFYTGHYVIRTPDPEKVGNLPIEEFGNWYDPESPTGYLPSKDTPYIIQWHHAYFSGKYISFFGAAGQTIPTFSAGDAPSSDNVVKVCVNNSMTTGSLAGAYMLESDYGNGAWLRLENASDEREIPPFECYLLVNNPTRARYIAIRPGMTAADTPTGWDDVINSEINTYIIVYSISGVCVTQYNDCSINEAGQRLSESYGEGLYILRADNESVKLMVGGK